MDLRSHDFVEFSFLVDGLRFQVSAGFVEDLVKEVSANHLRFQANGRDFLGQLFNLPFLQAKPFDETTLTAFAELCVADTYLAEYLALRGVKRRVVLNGGYRGTVIVPELTDAKRGPVFQQTADEVFTIPYQSRQGQLMLWGRNKPAELDPGESIRSTGDPNVLSFILRQNYSKVFSEVKVLYTGGSNQADFTPSRKLFNSDPRARQIFQPEIRTFQTSTLINTAGEVQIDPKMDQLAASILRKSNQNLDAVVTTAPYPYFVSAAGTKIPWEVNQLWRVQSPEDGLDVKLRVVGVGYTQDDSGLKTQLMFVGQDTLT